MSRGVLGCIFVGSVFLSPGRTGSQPVPPVQQMNGLNRLRACSTDTLHVENTFGNFRDAKGISADAFGNIYICDALLPGVLKFSAHGDSLASVVGFGSGNEQFDSPQDVDASLGNFVAVADYGNDRIQVYSKELLWKFSFSGRTSDGTKEKMFGYPRDVAMNSAGVCYLIDGEAKRAIKLQPKSNTFSLLGTNGSSAATIWDPVSLVVNETDEVAVLNSDGLVTSIGALGEIKGSYRPSPRVVKLTKIGEDLIYIFKQSTDIVRADFSTLAPKSVIHISGLDGEIRDVTSSGSRLYILTQKRVYQCTIGF